jgi:hypothetical protein
MTRRDLSLSVLAVFALALLSSRAGASQVSYHLSGVVTQVTGSATSGVSALGVQHDAPVSIDWTIETTTPALSYNPAVNSTEYRATTPTNGIVSITIKIGDWTATADPNAPADVQVNRIIVGGGGTQLAPGQTLDISRTSTDTGQLVSDDAPNQALIVLNLLAPNGGASTSNALGDQNPSAYPESTGEVVGKNGEIDFSIGGPDPTAKCRAAQIADAGVLCQSTLACRATHAKSPDKDPMSAKLDACLQKAHDKFVAAFDKAAANAASRGLFCGTSEDGAAFADDFATAEAAVVTVVDSVSPQNPAVVSSWYSGAGAMCSAAAKAESKTVTRPTTKLALLRESARLKLGAAAQKAVDKAEAKGVVFDPAPDVAGLVESIDLLVDDVVAAANGS